MHSSTSCPLTSVGRFAASSDPLTGGGLLVSQQDAPSKAAMRDKMTHRVVTCAPKTGKTGGNSLGQYDGRNVAAVRCKEMAGQRVEHETGRRSGERGWYR